jgi:hypothetical protein
MKKGKQVIIKLLIVLISFFIIDGGRSVYLITNNLQIILASDNLTDLELPHQHNHLDFGEDDKWADSINYNFALLNFTPLIFTFNQDISSRDISDSIWQPPKFV